MMKSYLLIGFLAFALVAPSPADVVVDFEELNQFTASNASGSWYNGNVGNGVSNSTGWSSGGAFFKNTYSNFGSFDSWEGWAYSNVTETTTAGFGNQYAAFSGGGSDGMGGISSGGKYAIAFGNGAFFNLPSQTIVDSLEITNTTYAGISMRDGDAFAKKFGGDTGNDPDFFRVKFIGRSESNGLGSNTGEVEIYLADYRFSINAQDYILNTWQTVGLSGLGSVRSVSIQFESSDVGPFGMNTPAYFAVDRLRLTSVPEPAMGLLLAGLGVVVLTRRWRTKVIGC